VQRILSTVLLTVACAGAPGPAFAAAYDDFARGVSANLQGDSDQAITSFTAAIKAGDLAPALLPTAYRGRAVAYLRKQNCAAAGPDADAALALKPDDYDLKFMRASIDVCLGQLDLALAGYSAVIAAHPGTDVYAARAYLRWRMGDFAGTAADFAQVVNLAPKYTYGAIWLALAQARSGAPDLVQAKNAVSRVDKDEWPAPILLLVAGESTPDTVEAAAARGEDGTAVRQKCEADFYIAEWSLGRGDAASALPFLARAAAACPHNQAEFAAAKLELARLK
jgi:lipoprotein NlpI